MPIPYLHHLTALLIGVCLPLVTVAQDERWYQVELLIFSHEDTVTNEQWEPLPALAYPGAGRFLTYPQLIESRVEEQREVAAALTAAAAGDDPEVVFQIESEMDPFGRQFIRVFPEEVLETPDIPLREETPDAEQPAPEDPQSIPDEELLPLLPTPFVALPRSQREFYGKAAYMQRTGYYQTLFHETWVQPVGDEQQAIALIIDRSGDEQDWPRLQGSVKLHLSRFLHLETNLWLNTDGYYLPGEWRMPAPPLGPVSLVVDAPEPEPEEEEEPPYFVTPEMAPSPGDGTIAGEEAEEAEEAEEPEGPVYPWRHAALLSQKRKMRSNEVHYIDHPLLGVVVKLTPLDEDQLQLMAEAEFATAEQAR